MVIGGMWTCLQYMYQKYWVQILCNSNLSLTGFDSNRLKKSEKDKFWNLLQIIFLRKFEKISLDPKRYKTEAATRDVL